VKICFVGLDNLALLAPRYGRHAAGDEALQQTLLARALARRGHEVSMVVADLGQADGAQWDGVRTFKARSRWAGLWPALARADADVYYASGAGAQAALLALYCLRHDRRLVLRASGPRFGLRGANAIVVPSASAQRALAPLRSRVAGPLVEAGPAAATRDIDVLWTSPMRGPARPDRALSLARRLPQARVHLAGGPLPGDEVLFREIRRMGEDIFNVQFHGALPHREALALYARAKLLLSTGDEDGLPQAWLQAWAHGVPVAALSDPGGVVAAKGLGVVAASPIRLFDAVRALLEDEAGWQVLSARCRRYMARARSEARVLRAYLAAFESAQRRGMPLHA
jgi:glycosyltransferase involved in cell wall biosynthesis